MLGEDFLAPLVAGTLFPDFTQRFLPFAVPAFDRARWLERAFEAGVVETGLAGPNPFEQSLLKSWSAEGPAPALLINTTEPIPGAGRGLAVHDGRLTGGLELSACASTGIMTPDAVLAATKSR